jgi:hypothetical protein
MPGFSHVAARGKSTVVSGSYRAYWDDLEIGQVLDGFVLRQTNSGIDITSDATGDTITDTIYSGTTYTVSFTLQNWNAQAVEPMISWFGAEPRADYEWGLSNGVGQRHWDAAAPLILVACHAEGWGIVPSVTTNEMDDPDVNTTLDRTMTAKASNPNIDPLDIVFPKTLLKKDVDIDILFSFRPRYLTITLDVFPIANTDDAGSAFKPLEPDKVARVSDCSKIRYFSATRGQGPQTV